MQKLRRFVQKTLTLV